jgi:hypothetical protein
MDSLNLISTYNVVPVNIFYKNTDWDCYFYEPVVSNILMKSLRFPNLGSYYNEISDASTVNEAYELKKYIYEYNDQHNNPTKKFINTGTIDPYTSFWGVVSTQYIKGSYKAPVVRDIDLKRISPRRYRQACKKKIIVGGMTKRLECFCDFNGEYLAGKSTTIILENNKQDLLYTVAILNSTLISFWYMAFFKSLSLSGGYLRINHEQISKIPVPDVDVETKKKISRLVENVILIKRNDPYADICIFERRIDQMVYELYGLTEEEIKVVDGTFKK